MIAFLVYFPLRVNQEGTTISVEDAATLQARFQEIFPAVVRATVLDQWPETVFCSSEGIMYGNGEIWIRATDQRYAISAINLPDENKKDQTGTPPQLRLCLPHQRHIGLPSIQTPAAISATGPGRCRVPLPTSPT